MSLDIVLNALKAKQRIEHYQKIIKKIIGPVAIAFSF